MYYTNIKDFEQLSAKREDHIPVTRDAFANILKLASVIHAVKNTLLATFLALTITPAFAVSDFYKNALFTPSESLLKAEARGRIMIYDGLDIAMVEKAMDEQFERIDNMMFVGIRHPVADGEFVAENDGCE